MFEILGEDEEEGFDEVETFDSDDLWPSKAFVLVHRLDAGGREMLVWIGGEWEGVEDVEEEEQCDRAAAEAVRRLCQAQKLTCAKMEVVVEGSERDDFWDLFELG